MTGKLFVAIVALCTFASCKNNAKKALDFSNAMVARETAITPVITACEARVKQAYEAQDFAKIGEEGKNMEAQVQKTIDELRQIPAPDVKGAEQFKNIYLDYFGFIKSMYTAYKNYGNAASEEDRQKGLEEIRKIVDTKQAVLTKTRAAQETFAKENGFKLDGK